MNVFATVKTSINTREAAARYGVEVNRHGKALCPFHNDRHPSLFVDDDHYHCYACGEHGDVIDFWQTIISSPSVGKPQAPRHFMKPTSCGVRTMCENRCRQTGSVPSLHRMRDFTMWKPPTTFM